MQSSCIDCIILFNDIKSNITSVLSRLGTVHTDIRDKSKSIIKFKGRSDYYGFTVILSTSEKNRRALAWFYRTYDIPNLDEWNLFIKIFNLIEVPQHTLQMVDMLKQPTDIYVTINCITNTELNMSMNDTNISVPIGYGTLLPNEYLFQFNK